MPSLLQGPNQTKLIFREDAGEYRAIERLIDVLAQILGRAGTTRDADLRSYCASRYEPVSGNHRDADTHSVEAGHQRLRVFAWQILKREESNQTDCTFRSARHGEHAVTSRRESLNVDVYVGGAADSGGDCLRCALQRAQFLA